MVYLFIGLVLLMLIAPIVSILPGKSQKQIMAVRRAAMARGISVELTSIDDPNPSQEKYRTSTGRALPAKLQVAAYKGLSRQGASPGALQAFQVQRTLGQDGSRLGAFQSITDTPLSAPCLEFLGQHAGSLPDAVQQIIWDGRRLNVYWVEQPDTVMGEKIFTFIEEGLQWLAEFSSISTPD
jgi:hypothetical protein|tara:strand:+ start:3876 stop:4421 length:546 start_codon:yes stop_codon:yes gene_type:complete